jgi:hypothetical protein
VDEAKSDCEVLLNDCLRAAEHFLSRNGEFYPFGRTMRQSGEIDALAAYDGREHPPSADVIGLLKQGFAQEAQTGELRATALASDVLITPPGGIERSDALSVSLNHVSGYSVVVMAPYQLLGGAVKWGRIFALQGEGGVFPRPEN